MYTTAPNLSMVSEILFVLLFDATINTQYSVFYKIHN